MADTGIFATTAEIQRKVGANASATANVEAYINDFMTQVESQINDSIRFNFSDNYSGLNVDVKGLLKEAASNFAAIYVIMYDTDAIGQRQAEFRCDVLFDAGQRALKQLKDKDTQAFITDA